MWSFQRPHGLHSKGYQASWQGSTLLHHAVLQRSPMIAKSLSSEGSAGADAADDRPLTQLACAAEDDAFRQRAQRARPASMRWQGRWWHCQADQ